jgi:peptide/nickel transport system permease protein
LPNCMAPYLILLTAAIGAAIISESTLGYLGIGIPEPTPTWGGMLSRASVSVLHAPWEAAIPGIFITLTVLGFNLLGDALRDVLDPRLRGGR